MKKVVALLSLGILLVSCSNALPLEFVPFTDYMDVLDTKSDISKSNYYRTKDNKLLKLYEEYPGQNNVKEITDLSSLARSGSKRLLNSLDKAHLLVVPITFKDKDVSLLEDKRILLENAFFGADSMNEYYSVASFYNKSSYGHLTIEGEVTPFITYPKSVNEIDKSRSQSKDDIVSYALNALEEQGFDLDKYSTLDTDYLDGVYFVYDHPYSNKEENDIYWAITEHKSSPLGRLVNYSWSSIYFMQKEDDDMLASHKVRANTFIHETGHLLGLVDYYNTNSSYYYQPTGFMDMMDYNIGDHSSFSKYSLSWCQPYVVKDEGEITIHDFSTSGEFILIPSSKFDNNPYGEYLLVEYYTPKGLHDPSLFPSYSYTNSSGEKKVFTYPTKFGLRIYHVNARLGYYGSRQSQSYAYVDGSISEIEKHYKEGSYCIDYYHSNDVSGVNSEPLLHLLEATGENSFAYGNSASNSTLFRPGMIFNDNVFNGFTFNTGEQLRYTFEFSSFTSSSVSLRFRIK